jgi:uncharacterized phage protein (TIGR02220 family)
MQYIHIRNLEKYHPGYKDRELQWAKIYINMADGDPDTEMIVNEIDWARFIKIILLELRAKKPLPNLDTYWVKKGFDLKKRSMSLTLQMLHNFISYVEQDEKECVLEKSKRRVREEKDNLTQEVFDYFLLKTKKTFRMTPAAQNLIEQRLNDGYTLEQLKQAIDNFVQDDWPERHKHLDLIYCLGKQRGKPDALEKWLNYKPIPQARTP